MSDNEINVAIAEACGYRVKTANPSGKTECWHDDKIGWRELPHYTTDLNAMHEAEATMKPELFTIYDDRLNAKVYDDCGPILPNTGDPYKQLDRWKFHATARQRAEAFLRALGRWKEQEICSNKPKPKGN